jgi:hypothetical protein
MSIFTMIKENDPKPTEGSLGVGKKKKPITAENFSPKFSRCVKNATSTVTSSLVAPVTKIFRYGDGLAHRPKM